MTVRQAVKPLVHHEFDSRRLEAVFDRCFGVAHRTRLIGGAGEPFYRPVPAAGGCHQLHYREDFFASALHETAHWCIAGEKRRQLPDFGYWYDPDGRDPAAQAAFQRVESKPQALEWIFSQACGYPFQVSLDNLETDAALTSESFARQVALEATEMRARGLPLRAQVFFDALSQEFATGMTVSGLDFPLDTLS